MQNRRDNPEPGGEPIDFPGVTILQYAGDGRFSLEEDFWAYPAAMAASKQYLEAAATHDADHKQKRTRNDWGDGPPWTQGAATWSGSLGATR
jgi:hypothetical protein